MRLANNKSILLFILLFSLFTKFWGLGENPSYILDESLHVPAATNYLTSGHMLPDLWYHPPLKHVLLSGSMALFGNTPIGWRVRNALFGFLSILLLYLLARELFPDERVAALAAAFLATDPVHMLSSRSTGEEIAAILFMLMFLYSLVRYLKGGILWLILAGICLGLALSCKWYFLPLAPAVMVFALWRKKQQEGWNPGTVITIMLAFTCLPVCVYLLSFYPWFGRGYSLIEFYRMQIDAFQELRELQAGYFFNLVKADSGSALRWFMKPVLVLLGVSGEGPDHNRYQVFVNNFPIVALTLPAVAYAVLRIIKEGKRPWVTAPDTASVSGSLALMSLVFISLYAPMLIVSRPIFIYSMTTILPPAYILIAFFITAAMDQGNVKKDLHVAIIVIALLWGAYLFPLVSGRAVAIAAYDSLINALLP